MKKYLMIINPEAGNSKAIEPYMLSFFEKHNIKLDVKRTKRPMDAKRFASQAANRYDVVIAAGGDGTINEVVNGIANSKAKLGIIPLGTENALAHYLKIPSDYKKVAKIIVRERFMTLDLGKAKNRYFILTAGVGLDAETVNDLKPFLKNLLGRGAYALTALKKIMTHIPSRLEIWLDDQVLPRWGYFAVIGNVKYYGGNIEITQYAKPADGYLDVCIFKRTDVINMFKYFISAASHGSIPLTEFPNIEYFRVKRLRIKSKKQVFAHTDAEIIGTTPLTIEAVPKAIKVIY